MSLSFVIWACTCFSEKDFAICGKTITSVKRNIGNDLLSTLRNYGFKVSERISSNSFTVEFLNHKNRFFFFGGKDESSAALIQGMTLAGLLLDEVALMPRSFVSQSIARCSVEGARFWFNCNPENPKHWFFEEWIKKADEKNCLYLHFTMEDNPSLSRRTIERYKSIYSGAFFDRYILGKWVATSGLVYPETANKGLGIKAAPDDIADEYVISIDYGTVNPFSAGLWGCFDGVWYRIDEYYFSSKASGYQKTDEEYYEEILRLAEGRHISKIVIDPSAASFIETIRRHDFFYPVKANNDVMLGIHKVQSALRNGSVFIDPACKDAVREFSLYRWEENGSKDAVKKVDDHAMDDIRYFVSTCLNERNDEPVVFAI